MTPDDLAAIRAMIREELTAILDERGLKRPPSDVTDKRRKAAQIRWQKHRDAHAMHHASAEEPHKLNGSHAHAMQVHDTKPKKEKPPREIFELPEWVPGDQWREYCDMRQRIRKPMTDRAKGMAVAKLEELKDRGHHPARVLGQSIFNSWQGLFEVKQ